MVQTRSQAQYQASNRTNDWIITGLLKEVRIPAPKPQPPSPTIKTESPDPEINTLLFPHARSHANLNAPQSLSGLSRVFGVTGFNLILHHPPIYLETLNALRLYVEDFIVNCGFTEGWEPVEPNTKIHTAVFGHVLREAHVVASRLQAEQDVKIIEHALGWGLALYQTGGDCGGREEMQGMSEVHEGVYAFVRWILE
ncbi:hypothetical protein BDU57DRAFT_207255 [Ampelomyces quisqualis]|uniref:Uncharacterized protein n=1 Tax=Ampelomyces quisqualis TaxID=50730 RepID=A0A6A5QJN3_AMPQU|nr:hypothetical protein BDU57DRAFT_207255 [Ampelomyces quisqualis]